MVVHRRVDFPVGRSLTSRWKYQRPDVSWIAVSEAVKAALMEGGVAPSSVSVVRSAVPPPGPLAAREVMRAALGVPVDAELVGAVGHLAAHKGHCRLIEAFAAVARRRPRARLVIAGEGEERGKLEGLIARHGLRDVVSLLGFRADALAVVGALDLLVHPSLEEGLGTTILDALWIGCPVLATSAGGIPEALERGAFGEIVPPGDIAALTDGMSRCLDDLGEVKARALAGRDYLRTHNTVGSMVEGVLEVYGRATGERARAAGHRVDHQACTEERGLRWVY